MVHPFPHSMVLLRMIVDDPPPLVPDAALASARETYERFRRSPPSTESLVEDAVIAYGRIVWPYRKAFDALVRAELAAHEDARFVSRLPETLRSKYAAFRTGGGTMIGLQSGSARGTPFDP